jgi:hypothetical protein
MILEFFSEYSAAHPKPGSFPPRKHGGFRVSLRRWIEKKRPEIVLSIADRAQCPRRDDALTAYLPLEELPCNGLD